MLSWGVVKHVPLPWPSEVGKGHGMSRYMYARRRPCMSLSDFTAPHKATRLLVGHRPCHFRELFGLQPHAIRCTIPSNPLLWPLPCLIVTLSAVECDCDLDSGPRAAPFAPKYLVILCATESGSTSALKTVLPGRSSFCS